MTELIIIRGTQSSGKTTTAGLVYQGLLNFCERVHQFNGLEVDKDSVGKTSEGDTIDFEAILKFNNKRIGITSASDDVPKLRKELKEFIEIKIDIIVCCARSRNVESSAYRMILDEFSHSNNIALEIFTIHSENKEDKEMIKREIIETIINEIQNLVQN